VDLQNAKVDGLSGTIVQSAELGLPKIAGLTTDSGGADLLNLVAGSNTARVWYAGEDKARLAVMGTLGETDVIRNGENVWLWQSKTKTATHLTLPAGEDKKPAALPTGIPSTPQDAAEAALDAIDPTTVVTTTGAAKVAGRDAYELVLSPRATESLVGQVRLAIDAEKKIPLRVDVYAKDAANPAVRVAFQQISFTTPDAQQFTFNPPPGTKVNETNASKLEKEHKALEAEKPGLPGAGKPGKPALPAGEQPKVIGEGWASVVTAKLPKATGDEAKQLNGIVDMLPKVSGSWGAGHLFSSSLFTVLVTDDGRVFAGAVAPETLYKAAAR
jgi:outer membrane lipoprotein-sorting protein